MLTDTQFVLQQTSDVTVKRALATRPETFPTCWDFTCWCVLPTTTNSTFYKHGGDAYSARAHRTPPGSRIWNNNKQWNLECLFIIIYVKLPTMRFPPVVLLPSVSSWEQAKGILLSCDRNRFTKRGYEQTQAYHEHRKALCKLLSKPSEVGQTGSVSPPAKWEK